MKGGAGGGHVGRESFLYVKGRSFTHFSVFWRNETHFVCHQVLSDEKVKLVSHLKGELSFCSKQSFPADYSHSTGVHVNTSIHVSIS